MKVHNIIKIHNNIMWDSQYSTKYSYIQIDMENIHEYIVNYFQSHKTLL